MHGGTPLGAVGGWGAGCGLTGFHVVCRIRPESTGRSSVGHWLQVCHPPSRCTGRAKPGLARAECGQGSAPVPGTGSEIGLLGDYGSEQQLSSLSVPWCSAGPKFKLSNRVHVWGRVPEHVIMQVSILVPALRLS